MADTKSTGSPDGEPLYLSIGYLRRPHGVHGEMIMDLHTDFPERMKKGRRVFVGDEHKPMTLETVRPHASGRLVKLKGVNTPEEAGMYRNQWVFISKKDAVPLPEGQFYKHELYGLQVIDENDRPLGDLMEIIETGANDVYVVRNESGTEILLPAISSVILDLEPARGFIRVRVPEGLLDT